MPNYVTLADRYVEQDLTPYSSGIVGAGQAEISLADMQLFLDRLDWCYFTLPAQNDPLLKIALAAQAWQLLSLPVSHPIKGVHVVKSRPTGDGTIWRNDPWFWIYPTTTVIPPAPPPMPPPPTFAYARVMLNGIYVAFVHAAVVAIHQ